MVLRYQHRHFIGDRGAFSDFESFARIFLGEPLLPLGRASDLGLPLLPPCLVAPPLLSPDFHECKQNRLFKKEGMRCPLGCMR
jgi:hypothetical protein